jgi:hypothetical protein
MSAEKPRVAEVIERRPIFLMVSERDSAVLGLKPPDQIVEEDDTGRSDKLQGVEIEGDRFGPSIWRGLGSDQRRSQPGHGGPFELRRYLNRVWQTKMAPDGSFRAELLTGRLPALCSASAAAIKLA